MPPNTFEQSALLLASALETYLKANAETLHITSPHFSALMTALNNFRNAQSAQESEFQAFLTDLNSRYEAELQGNVIILQQKSNVINFPKK